MDEAIIPYYQKLLETDANPGLLLTKFYNEVFKLPFSTTTVVNFNRLVRLYGRQVLFNAIIDMSTMEDLDFSKKMIPLLTYFCKKQLGSDKTNTSADLRPYVKEYMKRLKRKPISTAVRSPFDEQENE